MCQEKMADNQPKKDDKIEKIKKEVDETTTIMQKNLNDMVKRGESLETLQDKTVDLEIGARGFRDNTITLKRKMFWKKVKSMILIGGIVVVILIVLSLMLWWAFKPSN
jgi:vesicle-associated membrane protein 4